MTDVHLIEPPSACIPPVGKRRPLRVNYSECLMCYRTILNGRDASIQSHWLEPTKRKRNRGEGAVFCPSCFKAAFPDVPDAAYFKSIEEKYLNRKRVLLLESEPVTQMIHEHFLEEMDCVADVAEDRVEAFEWAQQGYDAIFMNVGFPEREGIITMKKIRAWEQENNRPQTLIVALTGFDDEALKAACHRAGAHEVMSKPIQRERLKAVLGV